MIVVTSVTVLSVDHTVLLIVGTSMTVHFNDIVTVYPVSPPYYAEQFLERTHRRIRNQVYQVKCSVYRAF